MTSGRLFTAGLVVFVASILFSSKHARAQGTQGPIAPKPGTTVQKPPESTIRLKVALVNAPVAVHDPKGELVLDLQQNDFHVLDNGIAQKIESFDLGGGTALRRAGFRDQLAHRAASACRPEVRDCVHTNNCWPNG